MIENTIWSTAETDRDLGLNVLQDIAPNRSRENASVFAATLTGREPSHIHLPRRRRVVRLDDRGYIVA